MPGTALADVIVPEPFHQYVLQRTTELSALWQSGIIVNLDELGFPVGQNVPGGLKINMPFWNDLVGDDEVLDDTTNLSVKGITSGQDLAALLGRAAVFGATDLSGDLAGDDPMAVIGDRFANYWVVRQQIILLAVLAGAMSAANMTTNVYNISGLVGDAANFDAEAFLEAVYVLGDHRDKLAAIAVHSKTELAMAKLDLIDYRLDSEGNPTVPFYMGKRVIVDDSMPVSGDTYTSYIFGFGAIGYGEGSPKVPVEPDRSSLTNGGEEWLVQRRHFVLHPRGIAWNPGAGVPAKPTPSNAELGALANWNRVYDPKHIRIVKFVHKLAA